MRTARPISASFVTLLLALAYAAPTQAQEKPDVNFIVQTTADIIVPDGMTEDDFWRMEQEYYDKVITKSTLLKHYEVFRHAWGSEGASMVRVLEFANWADIEKFTKEEAAALMKAAWPDEAARKTFNKTRNSFIDPHHRDEIYEVYNKMRH